jgi:streptogramin lyase
VSQLAGTNEKVLKDIAKGGDMFKASFNHLRATGVDSKNRLYICEKVNNPVRRVDFVEQSVTTLLDQTGKPLDLLNPEGIVVDQFDGIYVADTGYHRILKINPRVQGAEINVVSNYCGKYGESAVSRLYRPTGLTIDKQDSLWICDSDHNCVRMLSDREFTPCLWSRQMRW